MKRLTVEEVRSEQVALLATFDGFCKTNGINFYLFAGSMLGAVRHHGIIPWDNDIDLAMKREDYEKLKTIMKSDDAHDVFRFLCFEHDPEYKWQHGRISKKGTYMKTAAGYSKLGLSIDIFPLDSQGDDYDQAVENIEKIYRYGALRIMSYDFKYKQLVMPKNITSEEALKRLKMFVDEGGQSEAYWVQKMIDLQTVFSSVKNPKFYGSNSDDVYKVVTRSACYADTCYVKFEGLDMPIPSGYDEILTAYYGDYMTPPPPEARTKMSTTEIYYL